MRSLVSGRDYSGNMENTHGLKTGRLSFGGRSSPFRGRPRLRFIGF